VTKTLARYIVSASYENLPEKVRKEGVRTLLNWIGVAVGGSRHETVNIAVAALEPFRVQPKRPFLGAENALTS
jgi:2-methylcitrate dehydratase PrpD